MASIRVRDGRWQARVKRRGFADQASSFSTKAEAERWARMVETQMDRGGYQEDSDAQKLTLGDLVAQYLLEVLPGTKSERDDRIRLSALCRNPVAITQIAKLTPARVALFRDERLAQVSAGTVIRELAYLSSVINHAKREWGLQIANPVSSVRRPTSPRGRDRVLSADERVTLLAHLSPQGRRNPLMEPLVRFALATAMRRSEILALKWRDLDLERRTARLHDSKNGEGRVVPLSSAALESLALVPKGKTDLVFPITAFALAAGFTRAVRRANLHDLRFHDLRHTAITDMAERLPNLIELSAVSGHKSLKMLQRYYHPNATNLALKLG